MKLYFKYPRNFNGKLFSKGVSEISNELSEHWYVKALIECKDVDLVEEPKTVEPEVKAEADAPAEAEAEPVKKASSRKRSPSV
jgi:hypothetical protein